MKLTVLVPALTGLLWASSALAETQIEINSPYMIELLDGEPVHTSMFNKKNNLNIKAGNHQLVLVFSAKYSSDDAYLITGEPLVINFIAADNQKLELIYKKPLDTKEAEKFLKDQKVVIRDSVSGQTLASNQFIMPTVDGFQLGRDYKQELINMGKSFNKTASVAASGAVAAATATGQQAPAMKTMAQNISQDDLTQLQELYKKANAETRKAFQMWQIQQQ